MSRENGPLPESRIAAAVPTGNEILGDMFTVELTTLTDIDPDPRFADATRQILLNFGIRRGAISLAIVDDPTIHKLNRRHLRHDYPTDVLSFVYQRTVDHLDGEVITSADTATREASQCGWSTSDELLLYFIHGTLHLVGLDDRTDTDRIEIRRWEDKYLRCYGLTPRWDADHSQRRSTQPAPPDINGGDSQT